MDRLTLERDNGVFVVTDGDGNQTRHDNPEHVLAELAQWLRQRGAFEGRGYQSGDTIFTVSWSGIPTPISQALAAGNSDNLKAAGD